MGVGDSLQTAYYVKFTRWLEAVNYHVSSLPKWYMFRKRRAWKKQFPKWEDFA